jgi:hypothetical protein
MILHLVTWVETHVYCPSSLRGRENARIVLNHYTVNEGGNAMDLHFREMKIFLARHAG